MDNTTERGCIILHDVCGADFLTGALGNRLGNFLDLGAGDEQRNAEHVVTKRLELQLALGLSAVDSKE